MNDATKAPGRIWAWAEDCGDVCVNEWVTAGDPDAPYEAYEYILATPEALAASPEVAALLAAAILDAQLRCMERGRLDTPDEIRAAALRGEKEPK